MNANHNHQRWPASFLVAGLQRSSAVIAIDDLHGDVRMQDLPKINPGGLPSAKLTVEKFP